MRASRLFQLAQRLADGRVHSSTELAREFGASGRTIYRDMELLSGLGYPVEALPGRDGGFRVIPGHAVDRAVLAEGELAAIEAALEGVGDLVGDRRVEAARDKLRGLLGRAAPRTRSWLRLDLGLGHGAEGIAENLKLAIEERRLVLLAYGDSEGRASERKVEPMALVHLWQDWYLWAYCRLRADWRLFKLARIVSARPLLERFPEREEPSEDAWRSAGGETEGEEALLRFSPRGLPRAREFFGEGALESEPGGWSRVRMTFPRNEWLYSFLLSFGSDVEVLSPPELVAELAGRLRQAAARYGAAGE